MMVATYSNQDMHHLYCTAMTLARVDGEEDAIL